MLDAWLQAHAPGYDTLQEEERQAVKDFALLWSLYEGYALDEEGSAKKILATVQQIQVNGRLDIAPFAPQMDYFFQRYHNGTDFTVHYPHLHLRGNDKPEMVEKVLRKEAPDDVSKLSVLLIIIYRLRNNLLHGKKWAYGIAGQLDNFRNANAALKIYLEHH